jgi:flagella basal body P-ring formation protein FlgA
MNNGIKILSVLLGVMCLLFFIGMAESFNNANLMGAVRDAVEKELKASISDDAEISAMRVVKGSEIIAGGEHYTVKNIAVEGRSGRNRINFSVGLRGKDAGINIIVEASYDVMTDVFISARPLARGTVLKEEDFYTIKQKSSKLPIGAVLSKEDIEGKMLKMNVGQGIVIKDAHLASQLSIKRGQKVNLIIEGNGVIINAQGMLKSDSVIGGTAKVQCDASKKEVSGILISPNTVRIKI